MSALIRDRYGVEVEAADETAVMVLDEAVHTLVGLEGDPVAAISAAADSGLVLARCLLAYLHCYSGSRRGYALARDVLDGTPDPSAPRERAHLAAARSWASGDLETATGHLERALLRPPPRPARAQDRFGPLPCPRGSGEPARRRRPGAPGLA